MPFEQQLSVQQLPALLREVERGELLVGTSDVSDERQARRLVRERAWRGGVATALFESILAGWPVGSVTVWRTSNRLKGVKKERGPYSYVIDGRARLATLLSELGTLADARDVSPRTQPLVFDAEHGTIHRSGPERSPLWFPIQEVFHSQAQHDFAKRLKRADARGFAANRFAHFVDAFFDASIPVLTVLGDEPPPQLQLKARFKPTREPDPRETGPWWCDVCGQPIEHASDGWVEWLMPNSAEGPGKRRASGKGLRLVHHAPASPLPQGCQYTTEEQERTRTLVSDLELKDFLGPDGLTQLLSLLLSHEGSREEIVRMISRLHTPGYERARFHFKKATATGIIEPNLPDGLHWQSEIKRTLDWADEEGHEP
jgi:hypothetical protein